VDKRFEKSETGMRISPEVLEDVCKKMIKMILFCLPDAFRGTIYSVGPIPDLQTIRIASGRRNGETDEIIWGASNPSGYDYPGKGWEDYRDRPGGILEAMAWCVETQKSWTAEDPENNIRSVRKQLEGKAGEDYHHMEPVLVKKADLWDEMPPTTVFPEDSKGKPLWVDSSNATVAVIKIHFLPGTIKQGDRSTRVIKELSHSLGTQMLSLHVREEALEKERRLAKQRQEAVDILAHEFRNLVPRIGFAYRAINNEIGYLREMWEKLIQDHCPEEPSKRVILNQLDKILLDLEKNHDDSGLLNKIVRLLHYHEQFMESCLLPHQNESWLRSNIKPLWQDILARTDLNWELKSQIEKLLEDLRKSFRLGLDKELRNKIDVVPAEIKDKWVELVYREINGENSVMIRECIELLDNVDLDLPRKRHCARNLVYLKSLVELIPVVEEKLNHQLEQLKNSK